MSKDGEVLDIIEKFNSVSPEDWKIVPNEKSLSSGQSKILLINHPKKGKGVFRLLKDNRAITKERFRREIKVLNHYNHKNIVGIIEHSKEEDNDCWYISKYGEDFKSYWNTYRADNSKEPDNIIIKAIEFILEVIDGMNSLHKQGIVHRDIKPDNLIIMDNSPVLIDFGLVYIKDEKRLTPKEHPANNRGFSADPMRYYIDEIVPWLDVFQISQLLIWMTCQRPPKGWYSPLSWQWVKYSPLISETSVLALRAISAICSDPELGPQNANELGILIQSLFTKKESKKNMEHKNEMTKISEAIIQGKSIKMTEKARAHSIFDSGFQLFSLTYYDFESEILEIIKRLSEDFSIKTIPNNNLSEWKQLIENRTQKDHYYSIHLYQFQFVIEENKFKAYLSISAGFKGPNSTIGVNLPEDVIPFWIQYQLSSDDSDVRISKGVVNRIVIGKNGVIKMYDEHFNKVKATGMDEVISETKCILIDDELWRKLYEI